MHDRFGMHSMLFGVHSEPSRWTSSTSRLVRAMELTNKNNVWGSRVVPVFCLNLRYVELVMSSMDLLIASIRFDTTWSKTIVTKNKFYKQL